jgi:hypothetical protein
VKVTDADPVIAEVGLISSVAGKTVPGAAAPVNTWTVCRPWTAAAGRQKPTCPCRGAPRPASMPILNLRELLCAVAHVGAEEVSIAQQIRRVLAPFLPLGPTGIRF